MGRIRAGPSLHSWQSVSLGSIVVSQGEPPVSLSFRLVFCGTLVQSILACVAALQCALGMRVPSGGALQVPHVPGRPASGLRAFPSSLLCVHLSASSICARLRKIFGVFVVLGHALVQLGCLPHRCLR